MPKGSHVEIRVYPGSVPPELAAEITSWDLASDEAWNWIDDLESEDKWLSVTFIGSKYQIEGRTTMMTECEELTSPSQHALIEHFGPSFCSSGIVGPSAVDHGSEFIT